MENSIRTYLENVKIIACQTHANLQLFPLINESESHLDYFTLDEALSQGVISVSEVDSSGSVPELMVSNKADRKILILDGEELVGAKQNRIVNTTILVANHSTCVIPVSCVEQGRWAYTTSEFSSKSRSMPSFMRAKKARKVHESVRRNGRYTADQHEIWGDISEFSSRMKVASPSMEMGAIYEEKNTEIKDYINNFQQVAGQVGGLFAINGGVVGLDSFGSNETFSKLHSKLVESYTLDAIDQKVRSTNTESSLENASAFLENIRNSSTESNDGVSLGTDIRISARELNGFALVYKNNLIHLSAFALQDENEFRQHSRMKRFSSRRRNRAR